MSTTSTISEVLETSLAHYRSTLGENLYGKRPAFLDLLEHKTKEAELQMKANLERELFGVRGWEQTNPYKREAETEMRNEGLRAVIAAAWDEANEKKRAEAEREMDINFEAVAAVADERAEDRARLMFKAIDEIFNETLVIETGVTVTWSAVFDTGGKEYNYAGILAGDGKWYVTGSETKGMKTEAFKTWLVNTAMRADRFVIEGVEL